MLIELIIGAIIISVLCATLVVAACILAGRSDERCQLSSDQQWYWSKEWQAKEAEADEDTAAGRYRDFDSVEEMIAYLNGDGADDGLRS